MVLGLYDTKIMGYRVKIMPYVISIFDEDNGIEGETVPNKIVEYLIKRFILFLKVVKHGSA